MWTKKYSDRRHECICAFYRFYNLEFSFGCSRACTNMIRWPKFLARARDQKSGRTHNMFACCGLCIQIRPRPMNFAQFINCLSWLNCSQPITRRVTFIASSICLPRAPWMNELMNKPFTTGGGNDEKKFKLEFISMRSICTFHFLCMFSLLDAPAANCIRFCIDFAAK